jgi:lipopolysaccharide export system protein LptA
VHTVLANVPGQQSASQTTDSATPTTGSTTPTCGTGKPKAAGSSSHAAGADAANAPQAVRIASGGLIYSDVLGQADFTGGVRADTADATIIARQATAYLEQSAKGEGAQAAGPPSIAGSLERVVATGKVEISRPGLSATGERLVYAAGDQDFLLTGTPNAPPRAVDARGTTTGAALRFNTCDDSVEALGQVPGEPARRVRTETHVSDKKKDNKR